MQTQTATVQLSPPCVPIRQPVQIGPDGVAGGNQQDPFPLPSGSFMIEISSLTIHSFPKPIRFIILPHDRITLDTREDQILQLDGKFGPAGIQQYDRAVVFVFDLP